MENAYFGGESDNTGQMQWNQKEKWLDTNHMLKFLLFLIYLLFMAFASEKRLKSAFCGISRVFENVSIYFCWWWCVAQDSYWRRKSNDFSNFLLTLLPLFCMSRSSIYAKWKKFWINFGGNHKKGWNWLVSAITKITTEIFKIPFRIVVKTNHERNFSFFGIIWCW